MLYIRQKIILSILIHSGFRVTKLQLMKWLFLMRHETNIHQKNSFYDFVPYHYGPYSFTVTNELAEMQRIGFIDQDETHVWEKSENIKKEFISLSKPIWDAISYIIQKYRNLQQNQLVEYVYTTYPWYTINSKTPKIKISSDMSKSFPAIYTIGYEGLSVEAFFNILLQNGIRTVIDVRNTPLSRKYGFSKGSLSNLCHRFDIQYVHFPQLGVPSVFRLNIKTFGKTEYQHLADMYEQEILNTENQAKKEVIYLLKKQPSVFLCFERIPAKCHRQRLATVLAQITGLKVYDLTENSTYGSKNAYFNYCENLPSSIQKV